MNTWHQDKGSIMPLILGLFAIVTAFGAVAVDLSYLAVERARAGGLADSVALVAAQQIDVYRQPNLSITERQRLLLSTRQARTAARGELQKYQARDLSQRRLERFAVRDNAVEVSISASIQMPFISVIRRAVGGEGVVRVRASAAAATFSDPRQ